MSIYISSSTLFLIKRPFLSLLCGHQRRLLIHPTFQMASFWIHFSLWTQFCPFHWITNCTWAMMMQVCVQGGRGCRGTGRATCAHKLYSKERLQTRGAPPHASPPVPRQLWFLTPKLALWCPPQGRKWGWKVVNMGRQGDCQAAPLMIIDQLAYW